MTAQPETRLTWEEFLRFAQAFEGDARLELDEGRVVLAAGGTERHDLMTMAVWHRLSRAFDGRGCRTFIHNRLIRTSERSGFYPDLLVRCGRGTDPTFETDARVVVEVLSPGNYPADQTRRLYAYEQLPSIEAIVFVDLARGLITVHEKLATGWSEHQFADGVLALPDDLQVDLTGLWAEVEQQVTVG